MLSSGSIWETPIPVRLTRLHALQLPCYSWSHVHGAPIVRTARYNNLIPHTFFRDFCFGSVWQCDQKAMTYIKNGDCSQYLSRVWGQGQSLGREWRCECKCISLVSDKTPRGVSDHTSVATICQNVGKKIHLRNQLSAYGHWSDWTKAKNAVKPWFISFLTIWNSCFEQVKTTYVIF